MCNTCTPTQPATATPEPIQMGKQYQTRDGRPVRVLCVDRKDCAYPVVALINTGPDSETAVLYTEYGNYWKDGRDDRVDLIPFDPLAKFRDLPVDAPVWAQTDSKVWAPRHFASVDGERGHIRLFINGKTSHTEPVTSPWEPHRVSLTKPE